MYPRKLDILIIIYIYIHIHINIDPQNFTTLTNITIFIEIWLDCHLSKISCPSFAFSHLSLKSNPRPDPSYRLNNILYIELVLPYISTALQKMKSDIISIFGIIVKARVIYNDQTRKHELLKDLSS